ncbi:Glycosyl hydrolases family 43 [Pricia antarctica]|uniref:Glycosyl hydrolases family 43 n=1 Tax=Pricia antarctica TaxID=641691 RepID=A0A1G7CSH6_9FLAO|nr:family 43 glycosylhydrolase [Pricia antarctica]SDE42259.1 Glycosyl hydrolases family 43 [Pricia antarctica]
MIKKSVVAFAMALIVLASCKTSEEKKEVVAGEPAISEALIKKLGISNKDSLSAASKRAITMGYDVGPQWWTSFRITDIKGNLGYEEGVIKRDPSAVIQVDGTHYVFYSKSFGESLGFDTGDPSKKVFPWDLSEVWCAKSTDGITWNDVGLAVGRGEPGSYDDRAVFTPEVLAHEGKYYLVYQTVKAPYSNRVKNQVGMAIADSPEGPWKKLEAPILSPSDTGAWQGEEDNRFKVSEKGDFDSHKVHDPCLMFYRNKFYLYYKGERMGEEHFLGGREIKWGVAIADSIQGPYKKSPYNPVTNSGHEVCVWPYNGGMAAMLTSDGPENNTIQWSPDGINFEIKSHIGGRTNPPHAAGLVRSLDTAKSPLAAIEWGLCFDHKNGWDYIKRFETYVKNAD